MKESSPAESAMAVVLKLEVARRSWRLACHEENFLTPQRVLANSHLISPRRCVCRRPKHMHRCRVDMFQKIFLGL